MKINTKIGVNVEAKAYVREKYGKFYVSIVYKNLAGVRRDKSFPTGLTVRGNKTKAKEMADDILRNFEIPDEDLFLNVNSSIVKDGSVWLGHSDFATTANIYAHLDATSKMISMNVMTGLVTA